MGVAKQPKQPNAKQSKAKQQQQSVLLPNRSADELKLTFAGNIVKHLGVQMYAGRPVPAIAELVSNAWDADATQVDIHVPLDAAWETANAGHYIEVSDNGLGMNWDMIRDGYLDVGRDRRLDLNTDRSPGGRLVQGRKGVGKLAGFGIADIVEVQTVHKEKDKSIGALSLIWFRMNLATLKSAKVSAPVEVVFAGPLSTAPQGTRKKHGTTVTLRQLHERRAQNADRFHHSMAQRFLFLGAQFRLRINKQDLRDEDIDLQWRFPEKGWQTEEVEGCGPVNYWFGFTKNPRQQNEGEQSGILIYTRNKVSQEATFFDISGGVTGQHGLRYMVGKVRVEWLDASVHSPDLIATHRGTIAWESPPGEALQNWGQKAVKKHLTEWSKRRMQLRVKQVEELHPKLKKRMDQLAPAYKDVAHAFLDKFKTIEMEPEEFEEILSWFLDALENATLRSILQQLREAGQEDLEKLDDLLQKMEVRTAVSLLQIIESNLAAIETLEKMHGDDAKERGVLSKHIEKNPWLIEPTWMLNKSEARVSTWIEEEFGLNGKGKKKGGKKKTAKKKTVKGGDKDRVDFFCVAVGGSLHIVEIKRGRFVATTKEIHQANRYREYVLRRFEELSDAKAIKYTHVQSHLIAAELHPEAQSLKVAFGNQGWVFFTTWDDLIARAKHTHNQYREIFEKRAQEAAEEPTGIEA